MILHIDGTSGDKELEENVAKVYMETYTRFKSPEFDVAFQELLTEKFELFKKKQASYGPSNISALGYRGIFTRIWDKLQRLKNLLWESKPDTVGEAIEDTLGDLAVYAMMTIILLRNQWPPYVEETLKDEFLLEPVYDKDRFHKPKMQLFMEHYEQELSSMHKNMREE